MFKLDDITASCSRSQIAEDIEEAAILILVEASKFTSKALDPLPEFTVTGIDMTFFRNRYRLDDGAYRLSMVRHLTHYGP